MAREIRAKCKSIFGRSYNILKYCIKINAFQSNSKQKKRGPSYK